MSEKIPTLTPFIDKHDSENTPLHTTSTPMRRDNPIDRCLANFPHYRLGYLPTPLMRMRNLEKIFCGPRIFIKRDDQTGLSLGGNKTRKLEFLIGDALYRGADCIISAGAAQSNHCRQTAAAAATCGLECHLALGGDPPQVYRGNLLLDSLFGAHIHWSGEMRKGENISAIAKKLLHQGKTPYIIPYGGSNSTGALGFVAAMGELEKQLYDNRCVIDHIIFASSSGGTHSGMMVGKQILQAEYNLIGINIDKDEVFGMQLGEYIKKLANETAKNLAIPHTFQLREVKLIDSYLGEGYGIIGDLEREAIALTARHEGILVDPVYTGRAIGAMLDMIRRGNFGEEESVLFWHTGGSPALFAYDNELQNL